MSLSLSSLWRSFLADSDVLLFRTDAYNEEMNAGQMGVKVPGCRGGQDEGCNCGPDFIT